MKWRPATACLVGCFLTVSCAHPMKSTRRSRTPSPPERHSKGDRGRAKGPGAISSARPTRHHLTESEIRKLLKQKPDVGKLHFALGLRLHKKGDLDHAAVEYETAARLEPTLFEAHFNLGMLRLKQGRYRKAHEAFKQALAARPTSFDAAVNMAVCALRAKDFPAAKSAYLRASQIHPNDGRPLFFAGRIAEGMGHKKEAVALYRQAIDKGYDTAELHTRLALMAMATKAYSQAEKEFRKALAKDPKDAPALRQLGALLLRKKKTAEAVSLLQRAVKIQPDRPGTQFNLGLAALGIQKYETAGKALTQAVRLQPTNHMARLLLGVALLFQGRVTEGGGQIRRALQAKRRLWAYLPSYFQPLVDEKKLKSAARLLRELIRVRPKRVFRRNLKVIEQRLGRQ